MQTARNDEAALKVGDVARRAGVRVDTVRFYERMGLLPLAERTTSGYRCFSPAAVERILFVKKAQALGFSLEETADILRAIDRGEASYENGRERLVGALRRVDEKLAELRAVRKEITRVIAAFDAGYCEEMEKTAKRIKGRSRAG